METYQLRDYTMANPRPSINMLLTAAMANPQILINMLPAAATADAHLNLPKMSDYIANHIIRNATISPTDADTICTICQYDLSPSSDSDTSASSSSPSGSENDLSIVRVRPCNHTFHAHCITSWVDSTASTRNTCPTCRTTLCRMNILSPSLAASWRTEQTAVPDPQLSQSNYTFILSYVGAQLSIIPAANSGFDANFSALPRMMRGWWVAQGNATVTAEHGMIGPRWVEMLASSRVSQ
jgi:hypothetical protein